MRRRFKILGGAALLVALVAGAFGAVQVFASGNPTQATATPAGVYSGAAYGNGWMASGGMGYAMMQAASQVLGVPVQDVYQGLLDGKTLADQAQAKGVAPSAIVDAFKATEQASLAKMVQAGTLTQQQADSDLQWYMNMANWMASNNLVGYGAYGPGMMTGWYDNALAEGIPMGPGMMGDWNFGQWGSGFGPGMMGGWSNGQSGVPYGPGMMGGQSGAGPAVPPSNQYGPGAGGGMMYGWPWSSPAVPAPGQRSGQYGPGMMGNGIWQSSPQVPSQSAPVSNQPAAPAASQAVAPVVSQPAAQAASQAQTSGPVANPAANTNGSVPAVNRQSIRSGVGAGMMGSGGIRQGGGMGMMGR